ncbi:MAG: NAD(P)-dependent oxidoreductase [Frankiaceae bacterium]|nr:NAD(P)-dependent oxidoreductase [Frankiaceae bacterium]
MIGLGQIGGEMANHLLEWPGGFTVYDVRAEAMTPFAEKGAHAAADLAEVASRARVISIVVLNDQQVREVVDELLPAAEPGTVIAIHSTIEAQTAVDLAGTAASHGVHVVDAPISGGFMGAAQGRLAVMVGGEAAAYERAEPVFRKWAALPMHLGPAGAGTRMKIARNLITFVGYAAAHEAERLAAAAGLDVSKLGAVVRHSDAITGGAGAVMLRSSTAPYGPEDGLRSIFEHTRELGEKDLSLAVALGDSLDIDLPLSTLALSRLAEALGVPHEET